MRKQVTAVLAGACALSLLAGCGGGGTKAADSQSKNAAKQVDLTVKTPAATGTADKVTWMLSSEPATLDADLDAGNVEDAVIGNLCERLFQLQPNFQVKPHLAKSEKHVTPTTIVYRLRRDVTFHDGTPMTAKDVAWSMNRHAKPGADESDEYEGVKSVKQTGKYEVTVKLKAPDAQFNMRMAGDGGIVWNRKVIDAEGDDFGTPTSADACSGPFELADWNGGSSLTLKAAKDYWDKSVDIRTNTITFKWGGPSSVVNAVNSGAADGTYLSDPSVLGPLAGNKKLGLYYGATTTSWQLFPTDKGAFADAKIRTAVSLAIDRKGIAKAAFHDRAQPWKLPVGSGAWGYAKAAFEKSSKSVNNTPAKPNTKNIAKAKKLVKAAGDPGTIVVASDGTPTQNVIANAVRSAAQQIGLKTRTQTVSSSQYSEFFASENARKKVDVIIGDWYLSKPDPLGMYDNVLSGSVNNYIGFDSSKYDTTFQAASAEYDGKKRQPKVVELRKIYMKNMLSVPIVMAPNTLVLSKKLTGVPAGISYLTYPWAADLGTA